MPIVALAVLPPVGDDRRTTAASLPKALGPCSLDPVLPGVVRSISLLSAVIWLGGPPAAAVLARWFPDADGKELR